MINIVTDIISRTVSELIPAYCSNFGHFAFLSPPLRASGQRTMFILGSLERKARNGLPISVDLTFLLGDTTESPRATRHRKSAILLQHSQFDSKF